VETKLLRPPIHELKIKVYRFPYFIHGSTIYIISGFTKKSQKTPLREIDYAMTVYSAFASKFQV
jgi:phage-related protein